MNDSQYVPGNAVSERPLTEQAEMLERKLTGNRVFARMRGKVAGFAMWELLDPTSEASPTRSLKEFDEFVRGVRVMRNLVVWLRWHGYRRAAEEVVRALSDEDYRIWCEEIPFDATVPGVLLMFDPEEMLPLCRWWADKESFWHLHLLDIHCRGRDVSFPEISDEMARLIEKHPFLLDEERKGRTGPFAGIRRCLIEPLLSQATTEGKEEFHRDRMRFVGRNFPMYTGKTADVNDRDNYDQGAFAYFFPQKDQAEVLAWFPREAQKKLSTWQFSVPNQFLRGTVQLVVGLYPEGQHPIWSKLSPSCVSKGFSSGLGAMLSPGNEFVDGKGGHIILRSW